MDAIVKQAMAKWPNVPHCYGWLALDARGVWRMRDEQAQARQQPGERIANRALLDFINRNYLHDGEGRWYFQNGPQRVYVDLEATPYIARTDPAQGFVLHTGEVLTGIEAVWMNEAGALILQTPTCLALLDDRDLAQCLKRLRTDEKEENEINDEQLLAWLETAPSHDRPLYLSLGECRVPVKNLPYPVRDRQFAQRFGFIHHPRPASP